MKKNIYVNCVLQNNNNATTLRMYAWQELLLIETSIAQLNKTFYIPVIGNLVFNLPHVRIFGTHHSDKELCEGFYLQL